MSISKYRIMWILVMFDLPTSTKAERAAATKFRKFLLDEGFERSQYSIYARFVGSREAYETRIKRIKGNLPRSGDVQILYITDRQYGEIVHFINREHVRAQNNPNSLIIY